MAINKFVDRQGNTLLDLSVDSVSPNRVLAGTTYHGPDGLQHTGTLDPGPLDYSQYNFIDYDGTLLYSYTDEELDALTALPAGPDHTADNLTFQEWNWTLADLKAWDRTRADRPLVGANLITTDGKSYLYLDTPLSGATLKFSMAGNNLTPNSVDWGDGTTDTNTSHVYANPGKYVIVIDTPEGSYWYISATNTSISTNIQYIRKIKIGRFNGRISLNACYYLESVSIPNSVIMGDSAFYNDQSIKTIVVPKSNKNLGTYTFYYCYLLSNISLPNDLSGNNGESIFYSCKNLKNIVLPNIKKMTYNMFNGSGIQEIVIPNSVTDIGTNSLFVPFLRNIIIPDSVTNMSTAFGSECILILDLSKQTKVISLSNSLGISSYKCTILVPSTLLDQYKSAPHWSDYASIMVGV